MILRKIVHKTFLFDQFLVPFWCRFGAVLQNKTILISGRFLRNNDTFEFQEFRALEIGLVFEVGTFCSTDDLEGKSVSVYSFVFPICFCLQLSLPSCLLRLLQQLQKRVLKLKPRFNKLSNMNQMLHGCLWNSQKDDTGMASGQG